MRKSLPNRDREGVIMGLRPTKGEEDAEWKACPTWANRRGAGAFACQLWRRHHEPALGPNCTDSLTVAVRK